MMRKSAFFKAIDYLSLLYFSEESFIISHDVEIRLFEGSDSITNTSIKVPRKTKTHRSLLGSARLQTG